MEMGGMNSPSSGNTTSGMMVPYLHITGGDNLLFKSWHPSSHGAIAGACIGLVALALLERLLNGIRNRLEGYWSRRALLITARNAAEGGSRHSNTNLENTKEDKSSIQDQVVWPRRTSPPFILAHDLPRGIIYTFQSAISYALMLAVMTFNVAYIWSIILGLGIGEMFFGRWGGGVWSANH